MRNSILEQSKSKPTGPRSEERIRQEMIEQFQAACLDVRFDTMQEILERISKRDAVALLRTAFPHKSKSWFERNLKYLTTMDSSGFYSFFGYPDPTASKAIRNSTRSTTATKASPTRLAFSV